MMILTSCAESAAMDIVEVFYAHAVQVLDEVRDTGGFELYLTNINKASARY